MLKNHRGFVITQTPFRISFFGGGTDLPQYFYKHGGQVLGAGIDKYVYVTMNSLERLLDKKIRLSYSKLENVDTPDELQHDLARTILKDHVHFERSEFLDIHNFADLPSSSGIGSSSAFTVGMLNAMYMLNGLYRTPDQLAREAIEIERVKLKEAGGWQDQYFAAYGGFNHFVFTKTGEVIVKPVAIAHEKLWALQASCLMVFTGATRSSAAIQSHFEQTTEEKEKMLAQTSAFVDQGLEILYNENSIEKMLADFGHLLHQAWEVKRSLAHNISNTQIDNVYELAIKAGAYGGKICGAGGGGFILFIVPKNLRDQVKQALSAYHQMDIKFDMAGSRSVFCHRS